VLVSNWTLEQKKIGMLAYKWLEPIEKSQTLKHEKILRLELAKTPINKRQSELLDSLRPVLRRVRDAIRTGIMGLKVKDSFSTKTALILYYYATGFPA